jgi:hypothetical protein
VAVPLSEQSYVRGISPVEPGDEGKIGVDSALLELEAEVNEVGEQFWYPAINKSEEVVPMAALR